MALNLSNASRFAPNHLSMMAAWPSRSACQPNALKGNIEFVGGDLHQGSDDALPDSILPTNTPTTLGHDAVNQPPMGFCRDPLSTRQGSVLRFDLFAR
jgi:hypothetical protein